jgi:signal transduction histidine kinase
MTYDAFIRPVDSETEFVHIAYYMGPHLVSGLRAIPLILLIQILIWLAGFPTAVRSARSLLTPLQNMTSDALALNSQFLPENIQSLSQKNLDILAGDIQLMDARQHARLWVSDLELKGLADAINTMLDRVHESYRQQSQFVSDASHELRTPISVIEGYASILDRWGKNDEKTLLESIDAIKGESSHMKDLVEHLLFLARGDNETIKIQWQMLDIVSLAEEVFRGAQVVSSHHQWHFTVEPVNEAIYLRGDEGLLKQALRILTDNAMRYSPEGGSIHLTISAQPEAVRIAVQDQGIGIPPHDIPRIFDRFFRSESSRSKKVCGTGLGLSIAKWIIDRHKGNIQAVSQEGTGTCITVVLPKNWDGGYS